MEAGRPVTCNNMGRDSDGLDKGGYRLAREVRVQMYLKFAFLRFIDRLDGAIEKKRSHDFWLNPPEG